MLLTNFNTKDRSKYEKAIEEYKKETGDCSLYIEEEAYWVNGYRDITMNALKASRNMDRSKFWKIFDTLKEYTRGYA